MLQPLFRDRIPVAVKLLSGAAIVLLTFAASANANIAPEAMVFFNIRPLGGPEQLCQTDIHSCSQMASSTPAEGLLEFQLFIDPQQWLHGAIPVTKFISYLDWPDAWTVVGGEYCREGFWWFETAGPGPHYLEAEWPCTVPDGMFLAMTIVFDVRGYGRFEPIGDCQLWLGCWPDDFVVYPTAQCAEAGTTCEYTDQPCSTWWFFCVPHWTETGLEMIGPEGGSAHGEMPFTAGTDIYEPCYGIHAHSDTPWIIPSISNGEHYWDFYLILDADLAGVAPGTYWAEVKVELDDSVARCLPVTVEVESTAGAEEPGAGSGPGGLPALRMASTNPCAGPFVLRYDNPRTSHVRCGVYDAAGREIAQLVEGIGSGGSRMITWDARDANGAPVRPGVYLIRIEAEGESRSSRAVVVR